MLLTCTNVDVRVTIAITAGRLVDAFAILWITGDSQATSPEDESIINEHSGIRVHPPWVIVPVAVGSWGVARSLACYNGSPRTLPR